MTSPSSVFDGPPLDPTSREARQWVRDELAKAEYSTKPSLWQRFLEWLQQLFAGQSNSALLPSWMVLLLALALLGVVALVVVRLVRPETVTRRRQVGRAAVDEEGLTAADYRTRARGASSRGDWDAVLLDSYRALAASAVERTLLSHLPGRTAHEVALSLGPVFPDHAEDLLACASEFDAVRYGHRRTTRAQASATTDLDATVLAARPRLAQPVVS